MRSETKRRPIIVLLTLGLLGWTGAVLAGPGTVEGWFKAGTDAKGYEIGTLDEDGDRIAYIRSLDPDPDKFGTLMQSFSAVDYLGERIRLKAMIRTRDVQNWVGMWMRVDKGKHSVAFDNMEERALHGTTDWQACDIVLDVPDDADKIALGLLLGGEGRAEWKAISFETVSKDVPLTGKYQHRRAKAPSNLNFEQ